MGIGGGEVLIQGFGVLYFEVGDGEAGEVLSEYLLPILGLLLDVAHCVEIILGEIAETSFRYGALEGAVGLKMEACSAADGIQVGGKNRKPDNLTVWPLHQDAVAALKVVFQLTEGGFFP
jgi:hypothetical protein